MSKTVEMLNELIEGNGRFIQDNGSELGKYVGGQSPKAVILSCADSRIVPEIIFDQWMGEIFVVRVAGNVACDPTIIQSLEYAVGHLNVPLLLVLGHTHCGAVALTESCMADEKDGGPLVEEIAAGFDADDDHIVANVKRQVKMLPVRSEIIANAMSDDKVGVMGAIYDLESGKVTLIQV